MMLLPCTKRNTGRSTHHGQIQLATILDMGTHGVRAWRGTANTGLSAEAEAMTRRQRERLRPYTAGTLALLALLGAALSLGVMLSGCGGDEPPGPAISTEPRPSQEQATTLVWAAHYGMIPAQLPTIGWVDPDAVQPNRCEEGAVELRGGCVFGYTYTSRSPVVVTVTVIARPGVPFSSTALAHELWHARLFIDFGDPDTHHLDPGFYPGAAVDWANQALRNQGL